ncbi:MAG: hypothetical protein ACR2HP_14275, partial [Ilumatobacteraceae bacterium]
MNPDRLAELEEERRFLLRSLRDLDAEHEVRDVDDADYDTLRDGYTKRAADVLREIEEGRSALPAPRRVGWPRRAVVVLGVIVVAVVAGVLVARFSGQRTPEGPVAGEVAGDDVTALLARAREALGIDLAQAQQLYQRVLEQDAQQVEALTYNAWLLFVGSRGADDELQASAADAARGQLQRAAELDPSYPDPRCFLAVVAAN